MEIEADAKMRQAVDEDRGRSFCPHLGLREDAETVFAFPAPANHCCWVRPPAAVKIDHQQKFCLTEWHVACPIFRQEEAVDRSHRGLWVEEGRRQALKIVAPVGTLLLVAALLLLRPWAGTTGGDGADGGTDVRQQVEGSGDGFLPLTPADGATATTTPHNAIEPQPSPTTVPSTATPVPLRNSAAIASTTPTNEPTSPAAETPPATPCGPPAGWVTYVVGSGETLFRIGLRYGVTVDQLQRANCLNTASIDAGQVIYVPYQEPLATETALPPTATSSPTATPVPPAATLPPTATSPPPTATSLPPTATSPPPTATSPPPTATPAQPTATSPPPTSTPLPLPSATPLPTSTPPISGAGHGAAPSLPSPGARR